jgi:hypothetical protein
MIRLSRTKVASEDVLYARRPQAPPRRAPSLPRKPRSRHTTPPMLARAWSRRSPPVGPVPSTTRLSRSARRQPR